MRAAWPAPNTRVGIFGARWTRGQRHSRWASPRTAQHNGNRSRQHNPAGDQGHLEQEQQTKRPEGTVRAGSHANQGAHQQHQQEIKPSRQQGHKERMTLPVVTRQTRIPATDPQARRCRWPPPRATGTDFAAQHRPRTVDSAGRAKGSQKLKHENRAEIKAIEHSGAGSAPRGRPAPPAAQNKPIRPVIGAGFPTGKCLAR